MRKLFMFLLATVQLLQAQNLVEFSRNVSTLNGQPFFVKGMYVSSGANLAKVRDIGVNVIMSYGTRSLTETAAINFLNDAAQNDLYVLFQLNPNKVKNIDLDYVAGMVNALKNHEALYGWYLFDEPSLSGISPEDLELSYGKIKELDTNHPVFTSNWEIRKYRYTTDVDMRQVYQGVPSEMQSSLKDATGDGYIAITDEIDMDWLPILNTHASKFGDKVTDPVLFPSPAQWYTGVAEGSGKYTELQNRAEDLNQSEIITNPFGKKDRYNVEFVMPGNFPDSEEKIRGQVACALANKGNCIYWWLFSDGVSINKRWGYYTAFHYTPTQNAHKKVISELDKFSDILIGTKVIDQQIVENGYIYRYIKNDAGKELVIVFDNSGVEKNITLTLPNGAHDIFQKLDDGGLYNLELASINLPKDGGLFLLHDPSATGLFDKKVSNKVLKQNFPNPFKSHTTIPFELEVDSEVEVRIYNLSGQVVRILANDFFSGGKHQLIWDGTGARGTRLMSGVYFCTIKTDLGEEKIKLLYY